MVLRNIGIILQKNPRVLSQEMRVFFTKYNDPSYVKLEKLEIILKLCNEENIDQVLSELKEYYIFIYLVGIPVRWMWILFVSLCELLVFVLLK